MTHAIRIHDYGGPERLSWDEVPSPDPRPGEALLRQTAIGLNYIDVYFRTGLYPLPTMPAVIGMEGAGVVEAVGDGVTDVAPGDIVAYAGALGAYAEKRTVKADRLVKLPASISAEVAAASLLQGLTAWFLLHRTYVVKPGDTILVHAAAGGVGLILCQWAKALGATVIGVVSTAEKAELARAHGCAHAIIGHDNLPARVKEITNGAMVPVVYDSVGKVTFDASLDCLAPLGLMVSFGNASGPVAPFQIATLAAKGSLFLTRPTMATYTAKREDLVAGATTLFSAISTGAVQVMVNQRFPLRDAAAAHTALESRQTTGSTVLLP